MNQARDVNSGVFWRTGKLIAIDKIEQFWEQTKAYSGTNFFVMSWRGPWGKPHLKACRDDQ